MNDDARQRGAAPLDDVEQKLGGGGGTLTPVRDNAKIKLSWSCPEVVEIIGVRRTENGAFPDYTIQTENLSYTPIES